MKFQTGRFLIDTMQNVIVNGDVETKIQPRSMDVLEYLIQNRHRVVNVDEILTNFWPGLFTEESTVHRRINLIRHALQDDPRAPTFIRTVVKRGYQYIGDVIEDKEPSRPEMLKISSIAILPFKDHSQFASFQWLADGLANELMVRLQGVNDLDVPGQAAVERFRDSRESPTAIAETLGVELLCSGTIYGDSQALRIFLEVLDHSEGKTLWSMEFFSNENDLIEMQRRLVDETASFFGRRVQQPNRMEMPTGTAARAAFLKYEYFNARDDANQRLEWIEKTLLLEPDFAYGHLQSAWVYLDRIRGASAAEAKMHVRDSLTRAGQLGMSEDPQWLNAWGGFLSRVEGRHPEAETYLRRAVTGGVYTQYAHLLMASGLIDEAVQLLRSATIRYPFMTADKHYLATALGLTGEFREMLDTLNEFIDIAPHNQLAHRSRILAQINLGELDMAEENITQLSKITQDPSISWAQRACRFHLWLASGQLEKAERTAVLFEKGAPLLAGKFHLTLGNDHGWDLLKPHLATFMITLPFHLIELSPALRQHPNIISWTENHGYTSLWRKELEHRQKSLTPG